MNTRLTKQVLALPNALLFISEIQKSLEEERAKRLHFYEIVDENKKMEFINGEIVFHSPATMQQNQVTGRLAALSSTFASLTHQGFVGIETIMVSLSRNDYTPDICFFPEEIARNFTDEQTHFPAPRWIVEVLSQSTVQNDRGIKFKDYAAHGVQEYWIIDTNAETIEQYTLLEGAYNLVLKAKEGIISSTTLHGFTIPIRAVFHRQEKAATLQAMIEQTKKTT